VPNLPTGVAGWAAFQKSLGGSGWAELQKAVDAYLDERPPDPSVEKPPPGAVDVLAGGRNHAAAVSAFKQMLPVLKHPRCANCHSSMTFLDGEDSYVGDGSLDAKGHFARIPGSGEPANHPGGTLDLIPSSPANSTGITLCRECHDKAPPPWSPGPTWTGLSDYELCQQMKSSKNDGELLLEHLRTDALILLAFRGQKAMTDAGPEPPPLGHDQFLRVATAWIGYMDAMKKFPRARSEGCPRNDAWSGAIEYTYTEAAKFTKFESHGMVHIVGGRATWSGLAQRIEDHSAKGCPSVMTASASGDGRMQLMTIDYTSETPITGFAVPSTRKVPLPRPNARDPATAMLTIFPGRYALGIELPLRGAGKYAGGGPACPGYKPVSQTFNVTINDTADGKFDPDNPDELSGTKTTTLFPGASVTMKWQFMRLNEAR
jgi:hypothetical protein